MQRKNAKVAEQADLILPWLSEDACSSLFEVCESEEKTVHHCPAWTAERLLIIQWFNSVDRVESRALILCALHFHINPLEYFSSTFAEIIKALTDPRSHCERGRGDQESGGKLCEAVETHLRHLTFAVGNSTTSRLSSTLFAPNWGLLAGLRLWRGPRVARLTPCSSSVASQTPLVTRWDYKLPVLKA